MPEHAEDYVHRIGRTGRAQREGDAATIVAPDEQAKLDAIEKFIDQQIPQHKLEDFNYFPEPIIRTSTAEKPRRVESVTPQRVVSADAGNSYRRLSRSSFLVCESNTLRFTF